MITENDIEMFGRHIERHHMSDVLKLKHIQHNLLPVQVMVFHVPSKHAK